MKRERERFAVSFATGGCILELVRQAAKSPKVRSFVLIDKGGPGSGTSELGIPEHDSSIAIESLMNCDAENPMTSRPSQILDIVVITPGGRHLRADLCR